MKYVRFKKDDEIKCGVLDEIVTFLSQIMILKPGDVISTGTPPGIGEVTIGDELEVRIEGIGSLRNRVGE